MLVEIFASRNFTNGILIRIYLLLCSVSLAFELNEGSILNIYIYIYCINYVVIISARGGLNPNFYYSVR